MCSSSLSVFCQTYTARPIDRRDFLRQPTPTTVRWQTTTTTTSLQAVAKGDAFKMGFKRESFNGDAAKTLRSPSTGTQSDKSLAVA